MCYEGTHVPVSDDLKGRHMPVDEDLKRTNMPVDVDLNHQVSKEHTTCQI